MEINIKIEPNEEPQEKTSTLQEEALIKSENCDYKIDITKSDIAMTKINPEELLKSTFNDLWSGESKLILPSCFWGQYFIEDDDKKLICLSEVMTKNDNFLIIKKIVISETKIVCYVFDSIIENNLFSFDNLVNFQIIQNLLKAFNDTPVCFGGVDYKCVPEDFYHKLYTHDTYLNVLRHIDCGFILTDFQRTCYLCSETQIVVNSFKNDQSNKFKREKFHKRIDRLEMENATFQHIIKDLRKDLDHKELNKRSLFTKLRKFDFPINQALLINECINRIETCNRNYKSSPKWISLCSMLYKKSESAYTFLRNKNVLPLPTPGSLKKNNK